MPFGPLLIIAILLGMVILLAGDPRRGGRTALAIVAVIGGIILMAVVFALIVKVR